MKAVKSILKKGLSLLAASLMVISCGRDATEQIKIRSLDVEAPEKVRVGENFTVRILEEAEMDSLTVSGVKPLQTSEDGRTYTFAFDYTGAQKIQFEGFRGEKKWQKTIRVTVLPAQNPLRLDYEIIQTLNHPGDSYTQGLEFADGYLYESKGQYGTSGVRKMDFPAMTVNHEISLNSEYFGEGLTLMNDTVFQLTWRERTCFLYNKDLKGKGVMPLPLAEGWGICNDGKALYISDGSQRLYRFNSRLKLLDSREVYLGQRPLNRLNELEFVSDKVYANVYQSDQIFRIDYKSGVADAMLDLSELRGKLTNPRAEVLNGIAYLPERNLFLVTGKYWDKAFLIAIKD